MNKFVISLFLLGMFLTSANAADVKIGFVNTERIFREAAPSVKAMKKIEDEFKRRDQELQRMDKQVKDLQTQLENDVGTMKESERRTKVEQLARLNRDFERMKREFREDLNLRKNEELATILDRANKVIQTIAETEKFDLILQEAVYKSPRIDITDKVIKALADK